MKLAQYKQGGSRTFSTQLFNMRKIKVFGYIFLIMISPFVLCSCIGNGQIFPTEEKTTNEITENEEHIQTWSEVDRTEATCTDDGIITYLCIECEEIKTSIYESALGHKEIIDNAVKATCTTTGLTEGKHCSVCNIILIKQEITPEEHDFDNNICKVCGFSNYSKELIFELSWRILF